VREEVRVMLERFPGEVSADRAAEIVAAAGAETLRDPIGAMHAKMLLAELARQRG
jgi:actin-like ATPase involved in cell morphogenesis